MKLKFESGRSMVEMLGVLAIVGVLSVGGIAGYSYGMDKYRANQTINDIMLMGVDVINQLEQGREVDLSEWGTKTTVGYDIDVVQDLDDTTQYGIQISGVPSSVCKIIGDGLSSTIAVYVGNADYEQSEDADPCDASNSNTMEFYFDAMTTSFGTCRTDSDCSDDETCRDGICVGEGVIISAPSCSTNDDCKSLMGECYGCSNYGTCEKTLNGQSCQDGAGTCQDAQCVLDTTCTSNADCDANKNQYCDDSNESDCCTANPTQCVVNPLTARAITVGETTQIMYISKTTVSWWDAKSMCEAKGLDMFSVSDLVEGWSEGETGATYTRTSLAVALDDVYSGATWTKNLTDGDNSGWAYLVSLGSGDVGVGARYYKFVSYAVCR